MEGRGPIAKFVCVRVYERSVCEKVVARHSFTVMLTHLTPYHFEHESQAMKQDAPG